MDLIYNENYVTHIMRTYFENRCDAPNGKLIFMMIISCKMTGETRLRAVGLNQDF